MRNIPPANFYAFAYTHLARCEYAYKFVKLNKVVSCFGLASERQRNREGEGEGKGERERATTHSFTPSNKKETIKYSWRFAYEKVKELHKLILLAVAGGCI